MGKLTHCEVCKNELPNAQLNLGAHPLCDDLIPIGQEVECKLYNIEVSLCPNCLTANQIFSVKKELLFPSTYHYRARFTKDVIEGMKELTKHVIDITGPSKNGDYILDVGCNDGSLLNNFYELGFVTVGVEPTDAANDVDPDKHKVYKSYFDMNLSKKIYNELGAPKIITFTNVFAHIDDLQQLIKSLNYLSDENTLIVIENHYLGAVLSKNQFDTFYHEHPRTYSSTSFDFISKLLNKEIISRVFPARYGGNIRVCIGNPTTYNLNYKMESFNESNFLDDFKLIEDNVNSWVEIKAKEIKKLVSIYGKLPAKAFPARGAILIKLLDLDENLISAVYERSGSKKIGNYVPGTRIEIKDENELFQQKTDAPILNIAWHIKEEIHKYLLNNANIKNIIDIK